MPRVEAFPLHWPEGWPRAKFREAGRFSMSLAAARDDLLRELDLMRAVGVVISSNAVLRKDGLPAAKQPYTYDPGVAVYFRTHDKQDRCVPCDRWTTIEANLRAIGLTISAIRGIERWGTPGMVDALFRGFAALPPSTTPRPKHWTAILDVPATATVEEIDQAFRRKTRQHHPDLGGNPETYLEILEGYSQARGVSR